MSNPIIKVEKVNKSFGESKNRIQVLHDISFAINKGEFVSIMGPSGCGKSTLLYLIGALDAWDSGSIEVCGNNLQLMTDREKSIMHRRDCGFIFQFYNLVPNLSVEENILLPVIMDGQKVQPFKPKLDELLGKIGLTEKRKAFPTELSGGQQQRVAIARALIMEPDVILADEPTGNLDQKSGLEIMKLFQKINRENGTTILQVTHSKEIASFGNRVINLLDGKLAQ